MFKRFWWVFLVGLVAGPVVGLLVGGIIAYVSPKKYESTAVLQVRPAVPPVNVAPSNDRLLISTELEVIRSQAVLEPVVESLDLTSRWVMPRDEVLLQLRESITTRQIKGTDLIEIRVRTSNPDDSKIIAEAVAEAYRSRRKEAERERADRALKELREAVRSQEDVVEEKRKVLTQMIRDGSYPGSSSKTAAQKHAQLEAEKIKLESQIDSLLRYDGEQLLTYAAGLNLPENIIKLLHPRWLEAKRQLEEAEKGGLGKDHPKVKQQRKIVEALKKDLEEGVVALRETLRAQLELVSEQTERLRIKKDEEEAEAGAPGIGRYSFDDAKSEFETAQSLLEKLKIKLISEEMGKRITAEPVAVHANPIEAVTPSSPNVPFHFLLGAAGGLLIGLIAPLFLIPIIQTLSPKRAA